MSITPTQQRPEWSPLNDTFISDLLIPDCNIQAGSASKVEIILNETNYRKYLEENPKKDLYFLAGVDPERGMERAGDSHVWKKSHFFLDYDIRTNEKKISDEEIKELARWLSRALADHPILHRWRYIVFTGNGLHVHYMGDPVEVKSSEDWQRGMRWLLDQAAAHTQLEPDRGCTNVARLCRLPGSYNNKHDQHTLVEILEYQDRTIDLSGMEKLRELLKEQGTLEKKIDSQDQVHRGIPEGARNTSLTSIAGSLHRKSLSETALLATLKNINALECKPPLDDREVENIVKSISKYPVAGKRNEKPTKASRAIIECIADVQREEVTWLWQDRIPAGKITMIDGDPGSGKSWCSMAIASAITTGSSLPEDSTKRDPANVLLLAAEDGLADTIRPRLEDMGANLEHVQVLTAICNEKGEERYPSLVNDLASIAEELERQKYSLVIIDPLNSYMGAELNTDKDAAVRSVLDPLARLAEQHQVAVLCIRHLTKSGRDKAIYRGQGSIAYTAASRVAHLVGINPENEEERAIICIKNNLAPPPTALAFGVHKGKFSWNGETYLTAEDLLCTHQASENRHPALDEAIDFLLTILANGALPYTEIERQAKDANIAERTLKRAKADLDVKSRREANVWVWELPESANTAKSTRSTPLAPFKKISSSQLPF